MPNDATPTTPVRQTRRTTPPQEKCCVRVVVSKSRLEPTLALLDRLRSKHEGVDSEIEAITPHGHEVHFVLAVGMPTNARWTRPSAELLAASRLILSVFDQMPAEAAQLVPRPDEEDRKACVGVLQRLRSSVPDRQVAI